MNYIPEDEIAIVLGKDSRMLDMICPLNTMVMPCSSTSCAWYNGPKRECSILSIAKALEDSACHWEELVKRRSAYEIIKNMKSKHDQEVKDAEYIDDGYGTQISPYCPVCGKRSMQIVRPGKFQCSHCG